jgi:hypothetical protein
MPRPDGIEATRGLRQHHLDRRIVALTTHADDESVLAALRAGATSAPPAPADQSANRLRQLDDDLLGAADIAESVAVLVALQLADELCAASSEASDDLVDVIDDERNVADTQSVRWRALGAAVGRRRMKLCQLDSSVPVWSLQHGNLGSDTLEPDDAVHPIALDRRLAPQFESELNEERHRVREVVDDDAHMIHPLDCHALNSRTTASVGPATGYNERDGRIESMRVLCSGYRPRG